MSGARIPVRLLTMQTIDRAERSLCRAYGFPPEIRALGLLSTDCDDATYIALDEATKAAQVCVVYARSLYAGAAHASTPLAGEVIGILGGATAADVKSGLARVRAVLPQLGFRAAEEQTGVVYLAHTLASSGSYLSALAGLAPGAPLAYLVAPPVEAALGLDAALKAADVRLRLLFRPPTETNFSGGLLSGTESACRAACAAFAAAVEAVAQTPIREN